MPYGYGMIDHPEGTTILVLGIVSWVACGLAAPFAWAMGNQALKEIDANPGRYANRSNVQIGRILGIVWCCLAMAGIAIVLIILATVAIAES
jgi:hypothetical protein